MSTTALLHAAGAVLATIILGTASACSTADPQTGTLASAGHSHGFVDSALVTEQMRRDGAMISNDGAGN
jgi:hypothetical protein